MMHKTLTGSEFDEYSTIEDCLHCGGVWLYVAEMERLEAFNGDPADDCRGLTSGAGCHHYAGECPENEGDCDLTACNCLMCHS